MTQEDVFRFGIGSGTRDKQSIMFQISIAVVEGRMLLGMQDFDIAQI